MSSNFRSRLQSKALLVGTLITLPVPEQDAEVQTAIAALTKTCRATGLPLGIFADSAKSAAPYIEKGFSLIAISTDCLHMARSARAELGAIRSEG